MFQLCSIVRIPHSLPISCIGAQIIIDYLVQRLYILFVDRFGTMQRSRPCAFAAPTVSSLATNPRHGSSICAPRRGVTTPFFASQAFGAPVATRANIPAAANANGLRMDVTVVVGDGEPIESAIRRFKKEVTKSGHLYELRRRRYFETNTEKRLRKAAAARRKARMARNMKRNKPARRPNPPKTQGLEKEDTGDSSEKPTVPSEPVVVASV